MFDETYYRQIWGTVHRHDYCEFLAHSLIAEYGKVRFLDVGTGCGYLVKMLREKGADAWGLDVSEYALSECCAPGFVRLGDMRNIPFASNSFDVVHSNGGWGYIPEEDIAMAWAECKRVGKIQRYNIDYDDDIPEHQLVVVKPKAWWDRQFSEQKILVACPVHECKEYSMQRWLDNVSAFTYPNFEVFCVDNSPSQSEFMSRWADKIPMVHIDTNQEPSYANRRIAKSMAVIQKKFLAGEYARWLNLECDVIPPKNIIETMLYWGRDSDWIAHSYPMREGQPRDVQQGIGCGMLSRPLAEAFDYELADSPDAWLWEQVRSDGRFKTMELWQYVEVQHLRE